MASVLILTYCTAVGHVVGHSLELDAQQRPITTEAIVICWSLSQNLTNFLQLSNFTLIDVGAGDFLGVQRIFCPKNFYATNFLPTNFL